MDLVNPELSVEFASKVKEVFAKSYLAPVESVSYTHLTLPTNREV